MAENFILSELSSSSDGEFTDENSEDLSYSELDESLPDCVLSRSGRIISLNISHNEFLLIPQGIGSFRNLVSLDVSNNGMTQVSAEILQLKKLRTLIARNNNLDTASIPKDFGLLTSLETLNFSGNKFRDVPMQFTELSKLQSLHLGGNKIEVIPSALKYLSCLQVLYLGGNRLTEIPAELGYLQSLRSLILCDNNLHSLPPTLINLRRLKSLSLHNNQLSTLPTEIVALDLVELSLRNNPLVVKFVQDLTYNPPSLLELSGRIVKIERLGYTRQDLPSNLVKYLNSAQRCVNPKCKGVYFSSKVEHVKFVDFCGKYRLPLLQYLCSPKCMEAPTVCISSDTDETDDEGTAAIHKMKKVLLG